MFRLFLAAALAVVAPEAWAGKLRHVIVIAMENTDAAALYGNMAEAPYINAELLPAAARATDFQDTLAFNVPSEPHYVMMEAGTNVFADQSFTGDGDPKMRRSTASTAHLVTQIEVAGKLSWMTYQQGINARTGACPIESHGEYAAKHNPFVFFRDVAGDPPAKDNPHCAAHTKSYDAFAADLAANAMASYVFVAPDLCHDMHDDCGASSDIRAGDDWLKSELPRLIAWANNNAAAIFIVWDEGRKSKQLPFFAVGAGVNPGFESKTPYWHGSLIRTVEAIFALPVLPTVKDAHDFGDMFKPGAYP